MQLVGGDPKTIDELLAQEYVKDTTIYRSRPGSSVKSRQTGKRPFEVQEIHRIDVGTFAMNPEVEQRVSKRQPLMITNDKYHENEEQIRQCEEQIRWYKKERRWLYIKAVFIIVSTIIVITCSLWLVFG